MNKKASHVGIILSFAIFITFLAFLYSITEPAFQTQKNQKILLSYLQKELLDKSSVQVISSTITIDSIESCVELEDLLNELKIDASNIVKDEYESITYSNLTQGNQDNLLINRINSSYNFFKIYNSIEFENMTEETIPSCQPLVIHENYSIGVTKKENYIFDVELINLINKYENNYLAFKSELKIPAGTDFAFNFESDNGTIISTSEKDITTSIYAEEVPIQYMDKNAKINYGFLTVKIW